MWARYCEIALAFFFTLNSYLFGYCSLESLAPPLIVLISLLNFRYRYIHPLNALIALSLIGSVFLASVPFPANQGYLIIGILLLVLSLIPPNASESPREWKEFIRNKH